MQCVCYILHCNCMVSLALLDSVEETFSLITCSHQVVASNRTPGCYRPPAFNKKATLKEARKGFHCVM